MLPDQLVNYFLNTGRKVSSNTETVIECTMLLLLNIRHFFHMKYNIKRVCYLLSKKLQGLYYFETEGESPASLSIIATCMIVSLQSSLGIRCVALLEGGLPQEGASQREMATPAKPVEARGRMVL